MRSTGRPMTPPCISLSRRHVVALAGATAAAAAAATAVGRPLGALAQTPVASPLPGEIYEAEDGTLTDTTVETTRTGYSGAGYVSTFEADGSGVEITVPVPEAGRYTVSIVYAADSEKTNDLMVNGNQVAGVYFPPSPEFAELEAGTVWMEAGDNTLGIRKNWGYVDVDAFRLAPAAPPPELSVPGTLVNADASPEALALMARLVESYGTATVSGQTEVEYAEWVEQTTGQRPALLGLDMMDYSPSRVERGTEPIATDEAIAWHEGGGIVQFQWHWNAPIGLIDEPGNEWYRGFYTEATTFDVADAMASPDGESYGLLVRDIDAIAVELLRLRDAGVPVLWRPMHEAEGRWFWWGAKGSGPLRALWDLVYTRLTDHHGLNNLIWVWTSADTPESLAWYPGDDRVDIVGADIYPPTGSHPTSLMLFERLVEMYDGRKMVAMTENGAMPDAEAMAREGARWAWFMTWGDMVQDAELNPPELVTEVYAHPDVLTHEDLADLAASSDRQPGSATPEG